MTVRIPGPGEILNGLPNDFTSNLPPFDFSKFEVKLPDIRMPRTYVTLDLETTGLHSGVNGICQIGAWVTGENEDHFKGYFLSDCNPNYIGDTCQPIRIDQSALDVNGFTRSRIDTAPVLRVVLRDFKDFVSKWTSNTQVIFVCQNTPFDIGFMRAAFHKAGYEDKIFRRNLDTITLGFIAYGEVLSLRAMCEREGLKNGDAHDALADAYTTSRLFHRLLKKVHAKV